MPDPGHLLVIRPDTTLIEIPNTYDAIKSGVDGEWFDVYKANDNIAFYIQDEGMLNGAPLNVVASMIARVTLWGPVVLCHGTPSDEGDTLPPTRYAIALAQSLAERWRDVIIYGHHCGQDLTVRPNADTIPPPRFIPLDDDEALAAYHRGETLLITEPTAGAVDPDEPSGGPPADQPPSKEQ